MKLLNAISLSMFQSISQRPYRILVSPITPKEAAQELKEKGLESCIGHEQAAALASKALGMPVPMNRVSTELKECEIAIVFQYQGPRLPEGVLTVPEGAKMEFFLVSSVQPTLGNHKLGIDSDWSSARGV